MKTAVNMFLLLSAIYFVGLGFSTSDFGLRCTKCLRDYHVVERQFFGYTYRKWNTLRFDGYDSEQLYGRPCSHIYRKGGFGRSFGGLWASGVGCGTTADGTLFRNRWNTIKAAVELEGKLDNPALFQRTVTLADTILPADATTADVQDENRFFAPRALASLVYRLEKVTNENEWIEALNKTEAEFNEMTGLGGGE